MMTPTVLIAGGLVAALLLLVLAVCVVAILTVALKAQDQRDSGVKVLTELRRMLRHVLDTIRRR